MKLAFSGLAFLLLLCVSSVHGCCPRRIWRWYISNSRVDKVYGPENGAVLSEGTYWATYRARHDLNWAVAYCTFPITVNVVRCGTLSNIANAQLNCTLSNIYGSVCNYTCNPGYEIVGQSALTCQANGLWNRTAPSCKPVSCGKPNPAVDTNVTCPKGYEYPNSCFVSCTAQGYRIEGLSSFSCQANKAWSARPPCVDYERPSFPNGCVASLSLFSGPRESPVALTGWPDPDVTDNSGQPVSFTYYPSRGTLAGVGDYVINVTATDTSGNSANCLFPVTVKARTCPRLTTPINGRVNCSYRYSEGSECTVTCDLGYEIVGQSPITCLRTRQWDEPLPACEPLSCSRPAAPPHGTLQCPNGYGYTAVCWLQCLPGFQTPTANTTMCQGDKSWSTPGTCLDIQPPQFIHGCTDNVEVYSTRMDQPNLVTWKRPDVIDNSGLDVKLVSNVTAANYSFPVGVTTVTYTATDMAGNSNNCSFKVTVITAVCPVPDFNPRMSYNCSNGYVYGANCSLSCEYGYPLVGSNTIVCERDDSVYPPDIFWNWNGPRSVPPTCANATCPALKPPNHGALSCLLGNAGWDCLVNCQSGYDIRYKLSDGGHYYCSLSTSVWTPSTVDDCIKPLRPNVGRIQSDLFYYTGDCSTSTDVIKDNFIKRMMDNSVLSGACAGVPTCNVDNVQVTCGQVRRKKSADEVHHRIKKQTSHYYQIVFKVLVVINSTSTIEEMQASISSLKDTLVSDLRSFIANGTFDEVGMNIDPEPGLPVLSADCPIGTKSSTARSSSVLSCVGCGTGYFLNSTLDACTKCPVGTYVDVDNATSCMSCPIGWSTARTGSRSSDDCRKLCSPGFVSPDGFTPCSPCPPGHYSTQTGVRRCSVCPPNTWTDRDGVNSSDLCSPADLVLSNTSVRVQFQLQTADWVALTLWVSLPANSSLSIRVGDYAEVYVNAPGAKVYNYNQSGLPVNTTEVVPNKWSRINVLLLSPGLSLVHRQLIPADYVIVPLPAAIGVWNGTRTSQIVLQTKDIKIYVSELKFPVNYYDPDSATDQYNITWPPSLTRVVSTPSVFNASDQCLCGEHGQCQYQGRITTCLCQEGWSGYTCQVPPDTCFHHQCQNGATCLRDMPAAGRNYSCQCPAKFTGINCTDQIVDGGWTQWSAWENCSTTCRGQQQRQRWCINPSPLNGGRNCTGGDAEIQNCGLPYCQVDGILGAWTVWSSCSTSCGSGEATRTRQCIAAPSTNISLGDLIVCNGNNKEVQICGSEVACPVHGSWSAWNEWGLCSVTCGGGQQSRVRSCDNPLPTNGGKNCSESTTDTRSCREDLCPSCKDLPKSFGTVWTCNTTQSPYLRTCTLSCLPDYVIAQEAPPFVCGEKTGYIWNHEGSNSNVTGQLPKCTKPKPPVGANYAKTVSMETGCDNGNAVASAAEANLASTVPCSPACRASVTSSCGSTSGNNRKRKSAPLLLLDVVVTVDLSPYQNISENDTAAWTQYNNLVTSVNHALSISGDPSLLTLTVGGKVIRPAAEQANSTIVIQCPPGSVFLQTNCADCPPGTKESEGRCEICPIGQYQDMSGATSCVTCPYGYTTELAGASHVSLCQVSIFDDPNTTLPPFPVGESGQLLAIILPIVLSCSAIIVVVVVLCYIFKKKKGDEKGWPISRRRSLVSPYASSSRPSLASIDPLGNFTVRDPSAISPFQYLDPPERPSSEKR